jgi:iron complex transport system permease protein
MSDRQKAAPEDTAEHRQGTGEGVYWPGAKGFCGKRNGPLLVALALLAISVIFALTVGQYHIRVSTLWRIVSLKLAGQALGEELAVPSMVLCAVRLPRVLMAILAGAALSVGGVVFQGIMKNPLVSPSFLGVTHGAIFGASIAIIFLGTSPLLVEGCAFFWAVMAVILVYAIGNRGINTITTLVIAGVIVSSVFMAAGSFLKYIADPYEHLPAITFWTMGGLNNVQWSNVARAIAIVCTGIAAITLFRGRLDLMALGDWRRSTWGVTSGRAGFSSYSRDLIVRTEATSCGFIMWVDIIVDHLSRLTRSQTRQADPLRRRGRRIFLLRRSPSCGTCSQARYRSASSRPS